MNQTARDKRRAYRIAYYRKNRQQVNAYQYAWKDKNPEKWKAFQRQSTLKRKFNISILEYEQLLKIQEYKCKICQILQSEIKSTFAVDHDHSTGKIRGLLCPNCNTGLGQFKDNPILLRSAISYLTSTPDQYPLHSPK